MNTSKSYVSFRLYGTAFCMRINVEKVFSNFFSGGHIQTVSMRLKKVGSKRTNEKVTKFPERSATLWAAVTAKNTNVSNNLESIETV